MIRILVVDDHKIFRQGIVSLLRAEEEFEVIAEAGSGSNAVRIAQNLHPDVIIMDISLPDFDGIEAARRIKASETGAVVILLTMHKEEELLEMASETGVEGYLLKDDAFDDLVYAIKAGLRGERFTSSSLGPGPVNPPTYPSAPSPLTRREKEIVALVAEGLTSKEIAEKLFLSVKTVETHRANIMEKLELKGLADLVRYAIKVGLIQP